jgi:hypothetical protein
MDFRFGMAYAIAGLACRVESLHPAHLAQGVLNMVQKFWQERIQLLMLMMNGAASVGIAIAIATAMSTAHATAARLASMAAAGKGEAGADSSAAMPANVQANAAGADRGASGKAEGAERCGPG